MATRSMTVDNMTVTTEEVLSAIFKEEATEDCPTTFTSVAVEMGIDTGDVFLALEDVEDEFLVSDRQGNVWFSIAWEDENDMLTGYARTRPAKPVKVAPKAATGLSRAQVVKSAKIVAAEKIIVPSVDTAPTKPVESSQSDTPAESKGENTMSAWTNTEHEPKLTPEHESGQYLPPAENIPVPPEGINHNKWELYWTAPTKQARAFWQAQCLIDLERWNADAPAREAAAKVAAEEAARIAAEEAAKVVEPEPVRLCPITGEPLPF